VYNEQKWGIFRLSESIQIDSADRIDLNRFSHH